MDPLNTVVSGEEPPPPSLLDGNQVEWTDYKGNLRDAILVLVKLLGNERGKQVFLKSLGIVRQLDSVDDNRLSKNFASIFNYQSQSMGMASTVDKPGMGRPPPPKTFMEHCGDGDVGGGGGVSAVIEKINGLILDPEYVELANENLNYTLSLEIEFFMGIRDKLFNEKEFFSYITAYCIDNWLHLLEIESPRLKNDFDRINEKIDRVLETCRVNFCRKSECLWGRVTAEGSAYVEARLIKEDEEGRLLLDLETRYPLLRLWLFSEYYTFHRSTLLLLEHRVGLVENSKLKSDLNIRCREWYAHWILSHLKSFDFIYTMIQDEDEVRFDQANSTFSFTFTELFRSVIRNLIDDKGRKLARGIFTCYFEIGGGEDEDQKGCPSEEEVLKFSCTVRKLLNDNDPNISDLIFWLHLHRFFIQKCTSIFRVINTWTSESFGSSKFLQRETKWASDEFPILSKRLTQHLSDLVERIWDEVSVTNSGEDMSYIREASRDEYKVVDGKYRFLREWFNYEQQTLYPSMQYLLQHKVALLRPSSMEELDDQWRLWRMTRMNGHLKATELVADVTMLLFDDDSESSSPSVMEISRREHEERARAENDPRGKGPMDEQEEESDEDCTYF
ncbi:hypothetical protein LWI29_037736 [Acer saccharum]|uniref:Uncharacterized protein n=1 Tax=Acer saccharum TaxID=4024 RepID=A0AA39W3V7_ACESA|nr:hypothetical protein LWI29_037736 [Acer saccharum]